jgi:3-hydroxyisobutyrate dehydrogenase
MTTVGFIGLGNMGGPMAANLAKSCERFVCFDIMGTAERAPVGETIATSVADVARAADTMSLSLPNGDATPGVVAEITDGKRRPRRALISRHPVSCGCSVPAGVRSWCGDETFE